MIQDISFFLIAADDGACARLLAPEGAEGAKSLPCGHQLLQQQVHAWHCQRYPIQPPQ